MNESPAHPRRRRVLAAALAIGSVAALTAGCSRGGGTPWRTTTTWGTTPTTDGHGHSDNDHANQTTTTMGDHGMDHGGGGAPGDLTPAQIARANKLVADTKASVQRQGLTVAMLRNTNQSGFVSIGDAMTGVEHFVHPARHYDGKEFDPSAIEAFAVKRVNGVETIVAAMYIMENGKTMNDTPDIAGDWTMFHDHVLSFRSSNPRDPGYYQLAFGGGFSRRTAPMLHVWLVDNPCGPFAGTDTRNMTGSCENHGH